MPSASSERLTSLLIDQQPPCVSIYQPTHRRHPENQQDPIRYRNLLERVESSLESHPDSKQAAGVLEKFRALVDDQEFWNHRTEGLAVLGSPTVFEVFDLQRSVDQLAVVADSFHVKPLLREAQSADRFQVLCLSRQEAKLYQGNRYALDPVEVTAFPTTLTGALGHELTEPHQTVASYGKGPARGAADGAMHHGHGGKKDEEEIDTKRFFRVIEQGVLDHYSRPSGLPLMLVALAEHQGEFREASHNPMLMDEGLAINPDALDVEELRQRAWEAIEPNYHARLEGLVDDFNLARSQQRGSDDLVEAAREAVAGRVGTLLVEADRTIPGRIDAATGKIEPAALSEPDVDDVLDDLAEVVLRMKGDVIVVPAERMPGPTGVAASYRY
ncbi:hypothetical protein Pla175_08320 [Pirellulimonas nuda]|uniref:Uncharacterized protein n=1 Tax=Pirellulimonas nuda TaxID=2528009 RepID=A0A518D7L4_9BACT|nr:hypothetical protein [Pirellulimonas nuda]QDU87470.1 hypothetical protein Pla175_08320 [Pirellulimonas nuda]